MKRFILILLLLTSVLTNNWAQLPDLNPPVKEQTEKEKKATPLKINRTASFPGGNRAMINFIKENLKYPEIGREYSLEGKIQVAFTVNEAGLLENLHIKQGLTEEFDQAVLDMIKKMPTWIPALKYGQRTKDDYELSLRFSLQ